MLGEFFRIFFTVFLVMDPIGIIPLFLSYTARYDAKTRKSIILKAILIAGLVLLVFLLAGKLLLEFFGIMPGAFFISGGILFFLIAFEMIYSRPTMSRDVPSRDVPSHDGTSNDGTSNDGTSNESETEKENENAQEKASVSVALFPLAIPLIAGPGLLTVIVMFVSNSESWFRSVCIMLPALVLSLIAAYILLRSSELLIKFFGSMGIFIMEKIMGLILAGFAVQFIYDGLLALGIISSL
jgi:multiple antibiotic resistance protein